MHVATTFSPKQGETRTSHGPIPHPSKLPSWLGRALLSLIAKNTVTIMDKFYMDYSDKNIPIPTHREYLKRLVEKIESVIRRMRWKALFFLNKDDKAEDTSTSNNESEEESDGDKNEYFGFKSKKAPCPVSELSGFEKDLINMVDNIQFQKVENPFQKKLKDDMDKINKSDQVFVQADKTRNVYKMDKNAYSKLLTEKITQKYKLSNEKIEDKISKEFSTIAGKLNLSERIDSTTE